MPNIKSAKKRVNVIATKTARNKAIKSNLKTVIKNADLALVNTAENRKETVEVAVRALDKACAKGILHRNAVARKKSQLTTRLNASL